MIDCRHVAAVLLVITLAVVAGCGPVTYVGEVRRASDAVDAARAAQAERYAPYWWTRATQYLHKAREVAGHADFQAANRFGRLASEAANVAEQQALEAAKDPAKRPPDLAPAKDPRVAPAKDPGVAPVKDPGVAPAKDAP